MTLAWEDLQSSEGERHRHASIRLSDMAAVQIDHHIRYLAMFKKAKACFSRDIPSEWGLEDCLGSGDGLEEEGKSVKKG